MKLQEQIKLIEERIKNDPNIWVPLFNKAFKNNDFKFGTQANRNRVYRVLAKNFAKKFQLMRNQQRFKNTKEFIKLYNLPQTPKRNRLLLTLGLKYSKVVPLWNNRDEHIKKMYNFLTDPYVRRIQKVVRKKPFNIKNNVAFLKRAGNVRMISNINKLNKYAAPLSIINKNKEIRNKLNPPARKIQTAFREHRNDRLRTLTMLAKVLGTRRELTYYSDVLVKLITRWSTAKNKNTITSTIAPCHIKPNQVPHRYLLNFMKQAYIVAHEVTLMSRGERSNFLDRLEKELFGGMPCLENFLEGLTNALYTQGFVWAGRTLKEPLVPNNARYLRNVVGPAITSWVTTMNANNKKVFNAKSFENRKNVFWKKIKNLNLVVPGGFFEKVSNYNKNGARYASSKAVRILNNNNNTYNYTN